MRPATSTASTSDARELPAYAARLVKARMAGKHPRWITVVLSDQWPSRADVQAHPHPLLCIPLRGYAPGVYDLRVCAGVPVDVWADNTKRLRALLGELVDVTAPVFWEDITAQGLARRESTRDEVTGKLTWPWWWSDQREARTWDFWGRWGERHRHRAAQRS